MGFKMIFDIQQSLFRGDVEIAPKFFGECQISLK